MRTSLISPIENGVLGSATVNSRSTQVPNDHGDSRLIDGAQWTVKSNSDTKIHGVGTLRTENIYTPVSSFLPALTTRTVPCSTTLHMRRSDFDER